ncbi:MAG: hypothetical protein R2748_12795 [Bryobacterales bacterium]
MLNRRRFHYSPPPLPPRPPRTPTQGTRPRIAVVVTYWAKPSSHADWIITKLMDGYWWKGKHVDSGVEVVSHRSARAQRPGTQDLPSERRAHL